MPIRRLISALLTLLVSASCATEPGAAAVCTSAAPRAESVGCCCSMQQPSSAQCCAADTDDAVGCCGSAREFPNPPQPAARRCDGALSPAAAVALYAVADLVRIQPHGALVSTPAFTALRDQQTWLRISRLTI